jgi:NTE family protein
MKIGISLGGCGAKGYAHIGVLKTFKQYGIECEVVAGTSIGAVIGAAYATDHLDEIEKFALEIKLKKVPALLNPAWRLNGLFSGKHAFDLMMEIFQVERIEDIQKKFGCVAVDITNVAPVYFTQGDLRTALRASSAIPGIITPVVIEDKTLVDGGLVQPVPVALAKNLGADFIIAIDLFGGDRHFKSFTFTENILPEKINMFFEFLTAWSRKIFKPRKYHRQRATHQERKMINLIEILINTSWVSHLALTEANFKECVPDFILRPTLAKIGIMDFHKAEEGIAAGVKIATAMIPGIKASLENLSRR